MPITALYLTSPAPTGTLRNDGIVKATKPKKNPMPALTNANVFAKSYESKITINYDAEDMFSGCQGCQ